MSFQETALTTAALLAATTLSAAQSIEWTIEPLFVTACDNREPALVVGPTGEEHLLFYFDATSGGRGQMRYASRRPGEAWSTPVFVADNAIHAPSLAVGPGEIAYASWSAAQGETERLKVLQSGTWADLGTPLPSGSFWKGGMGAAVLVGPSGAPAMAYFLGGPEDAAFSEWTTTGWATTIVESSHRVGKAMRATLRTDGSVLLAYLDQDENRTHLARRSTTGAWSIEVPTSQASMPLDVAVAPNGDEFLILRSADPGPILVFRKQAGGWFQDTSFPGAAYSSGRFVIGQDGRVHMVAVEPSGSLVDYLSWAEGEGWCVHPVACQEEAGRAADIAVTASGEVLIAFTRVADDTVVVARGAPAQPPVTAELSLNPRTLKLTSHGNHVTAYLSAEPQLVASILPWSLAVTEVNGATVAGLPVSAWDYLDHDADGIVETLMLKLDRSALAGLLVEGPNTVTVHGALQTGEVLEAADSIRAIP